MAGERLGRPVNRIAVTKKNKQADPSVRSACSLSGVCWTSPLFLRIALLADFSVSDCFHATGVLARLAGFFCFFAAGFFTFCGVGAGGGDEGENAREEEFGDVHRMEFVSLTFRQSNVFLSRCRRRFKIGFLAGTKPDILEGKMPRNGGPNVLWGMLDDPEPSAGMMDEGDGLAESGGDFVVVAVEIDGVVVVDARREQRRERCRSSSAAGGVGRMRPSPIWDWASQISRGTLPRERFTVRFWRAISIWRTSWDCCQLWARAWASRVTRRRWKVPKRRSILPLACGEGATRWATPSPRRARALEFALGIAVIVAGTWTEETQAVGVNDLGQAPGLEGLPEMLEGVPGRVRLDETAGEFEAGMVVDREQEGLLGGGGPPLVDGAVVLPKLGCARDGSGDRHGAGVPGRA